MAKPREATERTKMLLRYLLDNRISIPQAIAMLVKAEQILKNGKSLKEKAIQPDYEKRSQ